MTSFFIPPDSNNLRITHPNGSRINRTCSFEEFKKRLEKIIVDYNVEGFIKFSPEDSFVHGVDGESLSLAKAMNDSNEWISFLDWLRALPFAHIIFTQDGQLKNDIGLMMKMDVTKEKVPVEYRIYPNVKGELKHCQIFMFISNESTPVKWDSRQAAECFSAHILEKMKNVANNPIRTGKQLLNDDGSSWKYDSADDSSDDEEDGETLFGQSGVDKKQFIKDVWELFSSRGCKVIKKGDFYSFPSGFRILDEMAPTFLNKLLGSVFED